MQNMVRIASVGLVVIALALLVHAQSASSDDWPAGLPSPWEHVATGPDKSFYANGLIDWLHFKGDESHPELNEFITSYFAHVRLGNNATTLVPGSGPGIHTYDPTPSVPVHVIGQSPYEWK